MLVPGALLLLKCWLVIQCGSVTRNTAPEDLFEWGVVVVIPLPFSIKTLAKQRAIAACSSCWCNIQGFCWACSFSLRASRLEKKSLCLTRPSMQALMGHNPACSVCNERWHSWAPGAHTFLIPSIPEGLLEAHGRLAAQISQMQAEAVADPADGLPRDRKGGAPPSLLVHRLCALLCHTLMGAREGGRAGQTRLASPSTAASLALPPGHLPHP